MYESTILWLASLSGWERLGVGAIAWLVILVILMSFMKGADDPSED